MERRTPPSPNAFVLELFRAENTGDPFAFRAGKQRYTVRYADGLADGVDIDWDAALFGELAELHRAGADPAAGRRIGERLAAMMGQRNWDALLRALEASESPSVLTISARAAEIYALPWELVPLPGSGLPLGEAPRVRLRYAWPGVVPVPPAEDLGGAALLAWSGSVDVKGHVKALESAGIEHEVVELAERADLATALERRPAVLVLLAHGASTPDGEIGLAVGQRVIGSEEMAGLLAPLAPHLRAVVLCVCRGGGADPGTRTGSVAQRLHRAGIAVVLASRLPLRITASKALVPAFVGAALRGADPDEAFALARRAVARSAPDSLDVSSLQLYAAPGGEGALAGLAAPGADPARLVPALLALPAVREARDPDIAATFIALVTSCFLSALTEALPAAVREDLAWHSQRRGLLRAASVELGRPSVVSSDAEEHRLLMALTRTPLRSLTYRALWQALDDQERYGPDEALVIRRSTLDHARFERAFLSAWRAALRTPAGLRVSAWRDGLRGEQSALLRRMAVRALIPEDEPGWTELLARSGDGPPVPALPLLSELLEGRRDPLIVLVGPRVAGKTALVRRLAAAMARVWLEARERELDAWLPVMVDLGKDTFADDGSGPIDVVALHDEGRRRAWLRAVGAELDELGAGDETLAEPDSAQATVSFLDGLDRWTLDPARVRELLDGLRRHASGRRRFVIVAERSCFPDSTAEDLPRVELEPPVATDLSSPLGALARSPGLQAAIDLSDPSLQQPDAANPRVLSASGLEVLARSLADMQSHSRGARSSRLLAATLREQGALGPEDARDPAGALVWLMSRVAWQARRAQISRRPLSESGLNALLTEVGVRPEERLDLRGTISMALRCATPMESRELVGGHTRLERYLVARYWAFRLRQGLEDGPACWGTRVAELSGAPLLGPREDETFALLTEIITGGDHPSGVPGWSASERSRLAGWMASEANDETSGDSASFRDDRRPWFRAAALAIRCSVSPIAHAADERALRSMLAWYWLRQEPAYLIAPRIHLPDAGLERASLVDADLRDANLAGAQLGSANLWRARLEGARLDGASLERADLRKVEAKGAHLADARLSGANLEEAVLPEAHLERANLTGCQLETVRLSEVRADGADFNGARMSFASATSGSFVGARLTFAELRSADFIGANLDKANLHGAILSGAFLDGATLREANLSEASLVGASLVGADLSGANLRGANLEDTDLSDATLDGVLFDPTTRWPEGFEPPQP